MELDRPYLLTHFTIASGNDVSSRDPTRWVIEGSDDGANWTTIFDWNTGASPFSNRLEVIRFDGDGQDFATPAPYPWLRYRCTATDGDHPRAATAQADLPRALLSGPFLDTA